MKKRKNRTKRILMIMAVVIPLLMLIMFLKWRGDDVYAWPIPVEGVNLAQKVFSTNLIEKAACDAFLALTSTNVPYRAYREFQGYGLLGLGVQSIPELDERSKFLKLYIGLRCLRDGFEPNALGALCWRDFLACSGEYEALIAYNIQKGEIPLSLRGVLTADAIRMLTHGAGVKGRAAALQTAMLFSRETLMESVEQPDVYDEEAARKLIEGFRSAESERNLGSLEAAFCDDFASMLVSAAEIQSAITASSDKREVSTTPVSGFRLKGVSAWMLRQLSAAPELTKQHLEQLFSRLVFNSRKPYSPNSICADMPEWCSAEGSRPPWTRDPVGALLAESFLRHARYSAAVDPSIRLELRVARIAVALRVWKNTFGSYPDELSQLLQPLSTSSSENAGAQERPPLLIEADLLDPFATDSATRLRYRAEGTVWRLWSVGLDKIDGEGLVDAFTAKERHVKSSPDFVFTSQEREVRRAMMQK